MRFHDITKDDMKNGDGLRVVLWVSGCSHHCFNCQNPITWDPDDGILFDESSVNEIFRELSKEYISGITFTGGDPLYQSNINEITEFSKRIKEEFREKTIWLYTGDLWEDICEYPIMKYIDVLVDGEYVNALRDVNLMWKGSSNQRVIDVQKTIIKDDIKVPVIYCDDYFKNSVLGENVSGGVRVGTSCTF